MAECLQGGACLDVCAVVVTYHPDPTTFRRVLESVSPQVGAVVVVDNTASRDVGQFGERPPQSIAVVHMERNQGLAHAQNVGIQWAEGAGYRYVLLLDQDSTPAQGMVRVLVGALERLGATERVGAVGPRFHDLREDHEAPFVRVGFPLNRKIWCERPGQTVVCDFLISSGALIPMDVLKAVGPMSTGLFIDNIDLEWSFRARALGYSLHGVCDATMHHQLGDDRRPLPLGLGKAVVHGSTRLYYIMRNRLLLYRMAHTPRIWVAQDLIRVFAKLLLFGVLIGPRMRNARFMLRGLADGIQGREGPCPLRSD